MSSTQRRSALIAGLALLAMAVLAGYATFGIIAQAGLVPVSKLDLATQMMGVVAVLDVLVGVTLSVWLEQTVLAQLSAALRIAYALILAGAVFRLFTTSGDNVTRAAAFNGIFEPALGLFGVHLLVLALAIAATSRKWLAAAVALTGAGYLVDAVAPMFGVQLKVSSVTFVGEVVLMVWLLVAGLRRTTYASNRASHT